MQWKRMLFLIPVYLEYIYINFTLQTSANYKKNVIGADFVPFSGIKEVPSILMLNWLVKLV